MGELKKFIEDNNIEIIIKSSGRELIGMGCINNLDVSGIRNSMSELSTLENNNKIAEFIKHILLSNYVNDFT